MAEDRARRQRATAQHPILGRVATWIVPPARAEPEPAHIRSWGAGAPGEQRVGEVLDAIDGVIALHDRQVPGSRGNIDHIAICATGIWGIDAKRYVDAKVEFHDAGGWFRTDERLLVGGRDRTKLVKDLSWQIEAVRKAVPDTTVPVRGLLCFVESNWNWFAKPFSVRDVAVCWPLALPDLLRREGPLDRSACSTLARKLATTLPPA